MITGFRYGMGNGLESWGINIFVAKTSVFAIASYTSRSQQSQIAKGQDGDDERNGVGTLTAGQGGLLLH